MVWFSIKNFRWWKKNITIKNIGSRYYHLKIINKHLDYRKSTNNLKIINKHLNYRKLTNHLKILNKHLNYRRLIVKHLNHRGE